MVKKMSPYKGFLNWFSDPAENSKQKPFSCSPNHTDVYLLVFTMKVFALSIIMWKLNVLKWQNDLFVLIKKCWSTSLQGKQTCLLASVPERGSGFEAGGYWHQGWRRTKSEKQPKELMCCQRFTLTSELHGWTHAAKSPIFWGSSDAPWRFFHLFILWKVSFFCFYYCFKERLIHFACIKL